MSDQDLWVVFEIHNEEPLSQYILSCDEHEIPYELAVQELRKRQEKSPQTQFGMCPAKMLHAYYRDQDKARYKIEVQMTGGMWQDISDERREISPLTYSYYQLKNKKTEIEDGLRMVFGPDAVFRWVRVEE